MAMEAALKAIAEPRRRAILQLVWDREMTAGEIASRFEVTRPAISQHLRVLKEAGEGCTSGPRSRITSRGG